MVVARTITILRNHGLVIELRISKTLVDPEIELIKANATLKDGSILFVNEAAGENWREYSYHWQKDGKMIRRWDNAPHHKDLVNSPHHVHDGNDILSGEDVKLTDVLNFIEEKTRMKNG
jgi:predicted RNase H-like nuclease (RuvC/YqgF family)